MERELKESKKPKRSYNLDHYKKSIKRKERLSAGRSKTAFSRMNTKTTNGSDLPCQKSLISNQTIGSEIVTYAPKITNNSVRRGQFSRSRRMLKNKSQNLYSTTKSFFKKNDRNIVNNSKSFRRANSKNSFEGKNGEKFSKSFFNCSSPTGKDCGLNESRDPGTPGSVNGMKRSYMLYLSGMRKMKLREKKSKEKKIRKELKELTNEHTFKPQLNPRSVEIVNRILDKSREGNKSIYQRLLDEGKSSRLRKQKMSRMRDEMEASQHRFRPATNTM
jgi:hypothetical protein